MSSERRYFSLAAPYAVLVGALILALVVFTVLLGEWFPVGSSRVDLQACKLEYSIVSPK